MIRRTPTSLAGSPRALPHKGAPRTRGLDWSARVRWGLGILAVLAGLFYLLWPVLSLLFAACVFAYLLDPIVDRFEKRGRSREFGIIFLFLCTLLGLVVLVAVVVPSVSRQVQELSGNIGPYLSALTSSIEPYRAWIESRTGTTLPVNFEEFGAEIPGYLQQLSPDAQASVKAFLTKTLSSGIGIVQAILNLTLLPLFIFYVLRDWDRMVARIRSLVPPVWLSRVAPILSEIDDRLSSFVRGQITVCFLLAIIYSLGLWIVARIDLPIIVGCLAGGLFIIPYLGTAVGVILASILALLKFGVDYHILLVWAVFAGGQAIEGTVLTPYIVGEKVGLSPLVVMIALITGGSLLGIWGMLLAIPCAAALSVILGALVRKYRGSEFYRET